MLIVHVRVYYSAMLLLLQIGMAVGETEEERKKATFTRIKAQVSLKLKYNIDIISAESPRKSRA